MLKENCTSGCRLLFHKADLHVLKQTLFSGALPCKSHRYCHACVSASFVALFLSLHGVHSNSGTHALRSSLGVNPTGYKGASF